MAKWKVTAKEFFKIGMKIHEFPAERVLDYQFTNEQGKTFRIRVLEDGRLEVNVDAQLVVCPRATNTIDLELREH